MFILFVFLPNDKTIRQNHSNLKLFTYLPSSQMLPVLTIVAFLKNVHSVQWTFLPVEPKKDKIREQYLQVFVQWSMQVKIYTKSLYDWRVHVLKCQINQINPLNYWLYLLSMYTMKAVSVISTFGMTLNCLIKNWLNFVIE